MYARYRYLRSRALLILGAALLLYSGACASSLPYQGMTANQIFEHAQTAFGDGDYDEAERALNRLLVTFSAFERSADARLLLARAYYEKGTYLLASDEYLRFLRSFGSDPRAPEAALGVCESYAALSPITQRDQAYTKQAEVVCGNVVMDYRGHEVAQAALEVANTMRAKLAKKDYDNAEQYEQLGTLDSAILYWEIVKTEYGDTEWAPRALLRLVRAYQERGYDDLVEEYRDELFNSYPDSDAAQELRGNGSG